MSATPENGAREGIVDQSLAGAGNGWEGRNYLITQYTMCNEAVRPVNDKQHRVGAGRREAQGGKCTRPTKRCGKREPRKPFSLSLLHHALLLLRAAWLRTAVACAAHDESCTVVVEPWALWREVWVGSGHVV